MLKRAACHSMVSSQAPVASPNIDDENAVQFVTLAKAGVQAFNSYRLRRRQEAPSISHHAVHGGTQRSMRCAITAERYRVFNQKTAVGRLLVSFNALMDWRHIRKSVYRRVPDIGEGNIHV